MLRRTFLKAVFAAAVAPASAVKALYRPQVGLTDDTIRDLIATTLNALPPISLDRQVKFKNYVFAFQPTRPGLTKTSCGPGWFEYYEGDKLVRRCPLSEELLRTGAKLAKFQPPGRRCIM